MADAAAVPAHVAALVQQREQARAAGDDATVVWLTTQLRNMGYEVRRGSGWHRPPGALQLGLSQAPLWVRGLRVRHRSGKGPRAPLRRRCRAAAAVLDEGAVSLRVSRYARLDFTSRLTHVLRGRGTVPQVVEHRPPRPPHRDRAAPDGAAEVHLLRQLDRSLVPRPRRRPRPRPLHRPSRRWCRRRWWTCRRARTRSLAATTTTTAARRTTTRPCGSSRWPWRTSGPPTRAWTRPRPRTSASAPTTTRACSAAWPPPRPRPTKTTIGRRTTSGTAPRRTGPRRTPAPSGRETPSWRRRYLRPVSSRSASTLKSTTTSPSPSPATGRYRPWRAYVCDGTRAQQQCGKRVLSLAPTGARRGGRTP